MTTTAVIVEFFSTEWIEIMSIWINKTNYLVTKNTPYSATGKYWVNDGIVPALLVYQLVRAER